MALRKRRWTMKTSAAANTTTKNQGARKKDALKRSIKHDLRPGKGKATPQLRANHDETETKKYSQEEKIPCSMNRPSPL
jgi:hypothetical protein